MTGGFSRLLGVVYNVYRRVVLSFFVLITSSAAPSEKRISTEQNQLCLQGF